MIISDELAKRIVDTAMPLVHRNINIMNREGLIIATGHPHRYRTFHKGAKDVIETGTSIEIYPSELNLYPGALQGVNLPIVMEEQVVGVIGVFGHPDEVRDTGRLVKMITELILEQELLQNEIRSRNRLREQFFDMVLSKTSPEITPKLKRIAKALGTDLALTRSAIVVDIRELIRFYASEYGQSELLLERTSDTIYQAVLGSGLLTEQDIMVTHNEQVVILKHLTGSYCVNSLKNCANTLVSTLSYLKQVYLPCGVGSLVAEPADYHNSYEQALFSLEKCIPSSPLRSIYDKDIIVNYMLANILRQEKNSAFKRFITMFDECNSEGPDVANTIRVLLDSNLDLKCASKNLHIHRNTLLYRLHRFKSATGLDPIHSLDDAIICKLLLSNRRT